jgi:hypothetical protein
LWFYSVPHQKLDGHWFGLVDYRHQQMTRRGNLGSTFGELSYRLLGLHTQIARTASIGLAGIDRTRKQGSTVYRSQYSANRAV